MVVVTDNGRDVNVASSSFVATHTPPPVLNPDDPKTETVQSYLCFCPVLNRPSEIYSLPCLASDLVVVTCATMYCSVSTSNRAGGGGGIFLN